VNPHICIEQLEGYVYRMGGVHHTVDDDGSTIVIPLPTKHFQITDGECVLPLRITITDAPCTVVFAVLKVHVQQVPQHRRSARPLCLGVRKSKAFPCGLRVVALPRTDDYLHDVCMATPVQNASLSLLEFGEALGVFRSIVDSWARRRSRNMSDPPERQSDEPAEGH